MSEEHDSEPETAALLCADVALARRLASVLERLEVPAVAHAREDGRGVLAVPGSRVRMATSILGQVPGLVLEDGDEPFYRAHDASKDPHLFDHAVLQETPQQIRARGAAALADLSECVLRGAGSARDRALVALGKLGPDASPAVDGLILRLAAAGSAPVLGALLRATVPPAGRGGPLPPSLAELPRLAAHEDAQVRQLAIRALGALRFDDSAPVLAKALLDESPDVAIEADDAFLEWGAEDVGFDPELEAEEKSKIARERERFSRKH